jgi:mannopine transport system substrate-binding protein
MTRGRTGRLLFLVIALAGIGAMAGFRFSHSARPLAQRATGKLVIATGGGSYALFQKVAYVQPFERSTRVKVTFITGVDDNIPPLQAQVKSGNVLWDLTYCARATVAANPDLFQPLNRGVVRAPGLISRSFIDQKRALLDLEAFPVLSYSTKAFPHRHPSSWADYYNFTKFPGPRGAPNYGLDSAWLLPATALLADGAKPQNLVPLDLDRAYKKLNAIKPHIRAFYTGSSQYQDLMRSGDITMGISEDGRALQLIAAGVPVGIVWKQAFRYQDSLCIPKGAPHATAANQFIEWIYTHPQQQAVATAISLYGPPTTAGVRLAKDAGVTDFSSLHAQALIPDSDKLIAYIQSHSTELLDRYNKWLQK